jgi:hypothetical protein
LDTWLKNEKGTENIFPVPFSTLQIIFLVFLQKNDLSQGAVGRV